MSSIDSGVNSITAVVMTDFFDRFSTQPESERHHFRYARYLAFAIGAIIVLGSSLVQYVPGNITAVTNKTVNVLTVPIFCLFFFALFVRFASPVGVWIGTICSITTAVLIAFSGPIAKVLAVNLDVDPAMFGAEWIVMLDEPTGEIVTVVESTGAILKTVPDPISFQWIGPAALVVNITVGCIASKLFPSKRMRSEINDEPTN